MDGFINIMAYADSPVVTPNFAFFISIYLKDFTEPGAKLAGHRLKKHDRWSIIYASPNWHVGNLNVARARTPIHLDQQEGITSVSPGPVVEDEPEISLALELEEKAVVLEGGVAQPPPQAPLAPELLEQPLMLKI